MNEVKWRELPPSLKFIEFHISAWLVMSCVASSHLSIHSLCLHFNLMNQQRNQLSLMAGCLRRWANQAQPRKAKWKKRKFSGMESCRGDGPPAYNPQQSTKQASHHNSNSRIKILSLNCWFACFL